MAGRHVSPARAGLRGPGRLDGVDLARGLAVLSMLVAHLSPVHGLLDVSEYLTAPLFAVVIAVSMALRLQTGAVHPGRFVADNVLRGLLLLVVGLLLQQTYRQVDVVLPALGVLVVVLAPLAVALRRLPVLTVGLAVATAVLGPVVTDRARDAVVAGRVTGPLHDLLLWTAAGEHYRLVSFLPMALGGLALTLLLPRLDGALPAAVTGGVLVGAAGLVHLMGTRTESGAAAYSGTTAEVLAATFLACGVLALALAVTATARDHVPRLSTVLQPLLATGRLALTGYVLQILVLALVSLARGGASDDSLLLLALTTAVVVGACTLLDRRFGTGPLELLARAVRVPRRPDPAVAGRHVTRR